MYYKIVESSNGRNEYTLDEMIGDISAFSKELTLWGSNRVVKKWIRFRTNANKKPENSIKMVEDILFAMRKDIGFSKMRTGTLIKMIINDYDEYKMKKHTAN